MDISVWYSGYQLLWQWQIVVNSVVVEPKTPGGKEERTFDIPKPPYFYQ